MLQKHQLLHRCPHFSEILLKRNFPQVQQQLTELFSSFQNNRVKCDVCKKQLEIITICLKCEKPLCDIESQCVGEHLKLNPPDHCVVINIQSTLIACLLCKIEIYDFEQIQLEDNELYSNELINPQKIRIEYHKCFYRQEVQNNVLLRQNQTVQHAGLLNICNNSHLNCVIQVLMNFPAIQAILKKIHQEYEINQYLPKLVRKQILKEMCSLANTFSQNQFRIINPCNLIKNLAKLDIKMIGYSRKDAYDAFKIITNFLNEEFKFTNLQIYSKQTIIINQKYGQHDWNINADQQNYMDYSFIQSIFSGELLSNLYCLNCNKATKTTEQFSALSLEIPEKRVGNSYFWSKLIRTNTSISLLECLDYFYEPVEDTLTLCSCGARQGKRTYTFQKQPNLLCIHLQRFLYKNKKVTNHITFPVQDCDFSSYFNLKSEQIYRLYGLIVHISSQGGDHYETIIRQSNSTFISIKDQNISYVTQKYVEESEAMFLFYEKVDKNEITKESLKRNLKAQYYLLKTQELQIEDDQLCFLPHFWYEQFNYLAQPPMIITSHLFCPHGLLKPDYWDFRNENENLNTNTNTSQDLNGSFFINGESQIQISPVSFSDSSAHKQLELTSIIIPKVICQVLFEQFGGGPIIPKTIQTCKVCIEYAQLMSKRRKMERELIRKYENQNQISDKAFIINEEWLKRWQIYLYTTKITLKKNFIFGLSPPGEINNGVLIDGDQQLIPTKKEGVHFNVISSYIWKILYEIYGGGPTIQVQQLQDTFKLSNDDYKDINEMKTLLQTIIKQYM